MEGIRSRSPGKDSFVDDFGSIQSKTASQDQDDDKAREDLRSEASTVVWSAGTMPGAHQIAEQAQGQQQSGSATANGSEATETKKKGASRGFKPASSKRQQLIAEEAAAIYMMRPRTKKGRGLRRGSMVRCKTIAPKYGVTPKTIRDIWRGRTWVQATEHLWTEEERIQRAQGDDDDDSDEDEGTYEDPPKPSSSPRIRPSVKPSSTPATDGATPSNQNTSSSSQPAWPQALPTYGQGQGRAAMQGLQDFRSVGSAPAAASADFPSQGRPFMLPGTSADVSSSFSSDCSFNGFCAQAPSFLQAGTSAAHQQALAGALAAHQQALAGALRARETLDRQQQQQQQQQQQHQLSAAPAAAAAFGSQAPSAWNADGLWNADGIFGLAGGAQSRFQSSESVPFGPANPPHHQQAALALGLGGAGGGLSHCPGGAGPVCLGAGLSSAQPRFPAESAPGAEGTFVLPDGTRVRYCVEPPAQQQAPAAPAGAGGAWGRMGMVGDGRQLQQQPQQPMVGWPAAAAAAAAQPNLSMLINSQAQWNMQRF